IGVPVRLGWTGAYPMIRGLSAPRRMGGETVPGTVFPLAPFSRWHRFPAGTVFPPPPDSRGSRGPVRLCSGGRPSMRMPRVQVTIRSQLLLIASIAVALGGFVTVARWASKSPRFTWGDAFARERRNDDFKWIDDVPLDRSLATKSVGPLD